jgi:predicted phosphodiesterase
VDMNKTQLAIDLIKEKTGPDGKCTLSKKKLGEILNQRYPSEFPTPELGRSFIRSATGTNGEFKRKYNKLRIEWKGLSLPEPEKNDYSKFLIKEKRIGILSDIHFPYYDKEALNAAIAYLRKWEPGCILLNGDIIDAYQLSNWEKDPRKRSFKYELDMLRAFIIELRKIFPNTRIVYKIGNHCERYEKLILQRVPELVDLELFTFENVISAKELGIDVVRNKRLIKIGKLNVGHGHEFAKGFVAPVNPARGFYLKSKSNFIGGHHHQISSHQEQDINGNIIGSWSTGCLCELHPHYMPINRWQHGFATVENFGTDFSVQNLTIIKGKVM